MDELRIFFFGHVALRVKVLVTFLEIFGKL